MHQRRIGAPVARLGPRLGGPEDSLWSAFGLARCVRVLRRAAESSVREVPVPAQASLLAEVAAGQEWSLADAWQVPRPRHVTDDPREWHRAIFRAVPVWVGLALVLRNALVPVLGIDQGDSSAFDIAAADEREVLVSTTERHLDFHASVLVEDRSVTLSTVAREHHAAGRFYLEVVRRVHPLVVRAMLRRALRVLSEQAPNAGERELARHTSG